MGSQHTELANNGELVFLHPHPSSKNNTANTPDVKRELESLGSRVSWYKISPKWLNPFHSWNPFVAALDPIRAIRVMLLHRKAAAVISIFESGGLWILLLRKLLFFKPRIFLWDASVSNEWRVARWIQNIVFGRYDGFLMLTHSQLEVLEERCAKGAILGHIGYNLSDEFLECAEKALKKQTTNDYVLAIGDDVTRDYETLYATHSTEWPLILKTKWRPTTNETRANTEFISKRLSTQEYVDLIANARIVVIPMHETTHPGGITTLYEAMALGKPVVISESPIAKEIVRPHANGIVVPKEDYCALNSAINALWHDISKCTQIGRSGKEYINTSGTAKHLARRLTNHLR